MVNCKTIRRNIRRLFSKKLGKRTVRHAAAFRQMLTLSRRISDHIDENKCFLCAGYFESVRKKSQRKTKGYRALAL